MARLILIVPVLLGGACAPHSTTGEFGLAPLRHERFPELDTAVAHAIGAGVIVYAQEDLGQLMPVRDRNARGVIRVTGTLGGPDPAWVLVRRGDTDTVRISKGHVTGIWRRRTGADAATVAWSATGFAAAALLYLRFKSGDVVRSERPGVGEHVLVISASAILGGVLGVAVLGGSRRGAQVYPAPRIPGPP